MGRTGRMIAWAALGICINVGVAAANDENNGDTGPPSVLKGRVDGEPARNMMNRYLLRRVDEHWAQWQENYEDRTEPEAIEAYQQRLKEKFLDAIGGLPEPTPLNARTIGTIERDGFTVTRVIFESRPRHYVTAALYLPDEAEYEPPTPVCSCPAGLRPAGPRRRARGQGDPREPGQRDRRADHSTGIRFVIRSSPAEPRNDYTNAQRRRGPGP